MPLLDQRIAFGTAGDERLKMSDMNPGPATTDERSQLAALSEYQLEMRAQQLAEEHLTACEEAVDPDDDFDTELESPAVGPFCGCVTCVVREVLHAAWEPMMELARRTAEVIDAPRDKP